jgi:hypothetical protein
VEEAEQPQDSEPSLAPDPAPASDPPSASAPEQVVVSPAAASAPVLPTVAPLIVSAPPSAVAPIPAPPHADRSTGLVVFGIGQIILGLLTALMIPLVALGAVMSRLGPGGSMRPGQLLSATATYGFLAAVLITLGIGSVRYRRWARALTLITSWYWMLMGALITVLITAVLPVAMRAALQAQQNTAGAPSAEISMGAMAVIVTLIIVFMAFFLIVVPIAYVVFYSRDDVAATCHDRDPVERWTDRAPLPVLGASVVFFVGALYFLAGGLTAPVFPFFGRYLAGLPGAACLLVVAALDGYLAVATYRLKRAAWWIAVITLPLRLLSMILTYLKADLMEAYARMGRSEAELRVLESSPLLRGHVALWWSLVSVVAFFGYVVWLKRYFKSPASQAEITSTPAT